MMMINEPMTKARLIELLKDVPDDVYINVLNNDGESTANIQFWFEDLPTRQFVELRGHKSFQQIRRDERMKQQETNE